MVDPIYIIAILLGLAFLLPALDKTGNKVTGTLFFAGISAVSAVSFQWLWAFMFNSIETVQIFTAGSEPPLSINLRVGLEEAVFLSVINIMSLTGAVYMISTLSKKGVRAFVVYLLMILGLNGLVMTGDIFNLFVFLEITAIATYAVIGLNDSINSLASGFKYMLAGGIASIFLLLGIILIYSFTGSLNIEQITAMRSELPAVKAASAGFFFVFFAFFIEMKQFPVNGWAIDVYHGVNPGFTALNASIGAGGIFFAFYKLLPVMGTLLYKNLFVIGIITFVLSSLMAIKQKNSKRILGYSSVGQMGLLITASVYTVIVKERQVAFLSILLPLFLNHFFAKAGLFWIAGIVKKEDYRDWSVLRSNKTMLGIFTILVISLIGMPPFPGFWGKWNLIMGLASKDLHFYIWFILAGSLLEAVYMFRWLGFVLSPSSKKEIFEYNSFKFLAVQIVYTAVIVLSFYYIVRNTGSNIEFYLPFTAGLFLLTFRFIPEKIKGIISIAAIGLYSYYLLPLTAGYKWLFNAMFLSGGFLLMFSTFARVRKKSSFYGLLMLMLGSLTAIVNAENVLNFFISWEIMTISSYFLVIRGQKAREHALRYIIFSIAGAFLIMIGFAYGYEGFYNYGTLLLAEKHHVIIFILLTTGFLIKSAAFGFHVWIAGAYAEAEDEISPFFSALLSKSGIYGIILLILIVGVPSSGSVSLSYALGWIGALTAVTGTMLAIYQEDAKRLLAYSSMGQVGYLILALAAMTGLGWTAGLYQMINHFLIKGLLFMAIAGVIQRTGTSKMYEMGGLIKRMPWSYTSVMFGIIALSGVPPLTGFGSKWLLYNALIEKGWYIQTGVAFFAGTVAFLYLFRLIHSVFLGQPKDEFRDIKKASPWYIVPQYILIGVIMLFSMRPKILLDKISEIIEPVFGKALVWEGNTAFSSLGYWNAAMIMNIVGALFVILLAVLLIKSPKAQKVKQFNIVYAAERPERPELTHYAYAFYKPYQRAMGRMTVPRAKRFWNGVCEWTHSAADSLRKIYTGNGQTYIFYMLLTAAVLFFIIIGVN